MDKTLKEELEIISDLLVEWTLKSGCEISIATCKETDGIVCFSFCENEAGEIYKKLEEIR